MRNETRCLALSLVLAAACGESARNGLGRPDLVFAFADDGGAGGGLAPGLNGCGDTDPLCSSIGVNPPGQPFELQSDPMKDPNESDDGVNRDANGYLTLDSSHASFQYLWIANSQDWNRGTVSKLDSRSLREVARYFTVTCNSLKTGNTQGCDGANGCCALDDFPRFQARVAKQMPTPHQPVQLTDGYPSRTAVDFNGDVWVANRAFGGQSSVSKIANDLGECVDRNKNGRIDTSYDANGDGRIATDCNGDAMPDDLDTVKAKPCRNGAKQEFFGLDDECVLLTTNTGDYARTGRPLALGAGDVGTSDAWAGTYDDGRFFRIDGQTGLTRVEVQLPMDCKPYGLAIDAGGYGWAPNLGSGLCYFDTAMGNNNNVAVARLPQTGHSAYGVAIDRDQNVWTGGWDQGNAYRYTPDRSNGFARLGDGFWTTFQNPGSNAGTTGAGRGIAADSRTANAYFVWMARDDGYVVRLDASKTPPPKGMDMIIPAQAMPAMRVAGGQTIGVGVDTQQNVWGISYDGSVATRILVDANGKMAPPDITSMPKGNDRCPAGDTCGLQDSPNSTPSPYTYSDFTGFGLRNFTRQQGTYTTLYPACGQFGTRWLRIEWDADVPANTTLTVKARAGKSANLNDGTWGTWTPLYSQSPALLDGDLMPNGTDANDIQLQFALGTLDRSARPTLKSYAIWYECLTTGPG
jgi:hypothetical protein